MSNRLYIAGKEVTTDQGDLDVTLSYSIESTIPGEVQGAHSKRTVKLPATKENIQLFQYATEPGSTGNEAYKYLPARLTSQGLPILTGKARLSKSKTKATPNGFAPAGFSVGLFGNNADWMADVGNQLIRSLGWPVITLSVSEVEENRNPTTEDHAWALVKWKDWKRETSVTHTEFSPVVFVHRILEKAFAAQGYQFISPFTSDPFNRLVIPVGLSLDADFFVDFVNIRASVPSPASINVVSDAAGEVKITFTDETTDPNFDNGGNYTAGAYTVPITALYEIIAELTANIVATSGDPGGFNQLELHIRDELSNTLAIYDFALGHDWNTTFIFNGPFTWEFIDNLAAGKELEIYLVHSGVTFTATLSGYLAINAEKEDFDLGEQYNLQFLIPSSWYVRDLIKDLTFIFNLAWETDVAGGKVYAYPKDDYYLTYRANASGTITTSAFPGFFQNGNNLYDLSIREVQGGEMELIDGYKRNTILSYATDDPTTEGEEKRRGVNIYSGGYQFPEDRFENGIDFLYTNFFAKTLQINDPIITATSAAFGAQLPLIYGDDYNTTLDAKPNYYLAPRLLYYAGRRAGLDGEVNMYYESSSASSAFDFPAAFVTNYVDPSAGDWSLSFSDESTNALQVVPGLFRTMHMQEFKRREIGKRYTMRTKWSLSDIVNLTFRRKAGIGSSRFILQQIEYNPASTGLSKTIVLYDERPNVNDLAKIVNTATVAGANAQPGTVTGSGSGLVGAGTTTVNIQLGREIFLNHNSNILTLNANTGVLAVANTAANVGVYQNGQKLVQGVDYTISGVTVTVDPVRHYDGATYEVIVNGVTKS